MPYLGRELTSGNYLKLDDISSQFDGSTVTFNLKSGGNDFYPGSSFSLLVSVAGIIQEADSAYQIENNQITFASAPVGTDDCFIIVLGLALGIGVPGDGTVGLSQLTTEAKGVGISTSNANNTSSVQVGVGVTLLNFAGPGVTTAFVTSSTGVGTVFFQGGGGGGVGAAGTWASDSVGVATSKVVGVGTAQAVGTANSEGALQALGNIAITDGALLIDNDISSSINIPSGKNGLLIGTVNVAVGATIDVATGSVLVVV